MKEKAVILLSGGLDSTTLLHYLRKQLECEAIYALTFNYGQKHFARELSCARWQIRRLSVREHLVVDISFFKRFIGKSSALTSRFNPIPDYAAIRPRELSQPPTYVPNRNMILLALACAHAEALAITRVYYAAQRQDYYGYWDCSKQFVAGMNKVLRLNHRQAVRIEAPFAGAGKKQVLRTGLALGVDYAHTWSCYRGHKKACGQCPSCVERMAAFKANKVRDPLEYK
ncbi:MAG: 7-cyano-7-deazaguanine synthase QueC [Kiritimatiellae bacterium]|jgi:7-cyano-7-deazaguanine synthase|nr:7-cyano-7-deazaguanine synthase QueC [Kiritimatiellia bacterium]